jgi:hypothetical protein
MKFATVLLSAVFSGATAMSPVTTKGDDRAFCQVYTQRALRDAAEVRQLSTCAAKVRETKSWSLDPLIHFDWCLSTDQRNVRRETIDLMRFLLECRAWLSEAVRPLPFLSAMPSH